MKQDVKGSGPGPVDFLFWNFLGTYKTTNIWRQDIRCFGKN